MPYKIVEQKNKKFKVCKADDSKVCFSRKGIPYKTARKQIRAIVSGESKKVGGRRTLGYRRADWWDTRYDEFVTLARSLGVEEDEIYPMGVFKVKFEAEYNSSRVDSYEVSRVLAQQNYDEFDNQSSGSEEMVTALTPEEIEEKNKNKTELEKKYKLLADLFLIQKQTVNNGVIKTNDETFLDPYNIHEGDTDDILRNPNAETEYDRDNTRRKGYWTPDDKVNYDQLQAGYDFLVGYYNTNYHTSRSGNKVGAVLVNCNPSSWSNNLPNEDAMIGITAMIRMLGIDDRLSYSLCVDKCIGQPYGWNNFFDFDLYGICYVVSGDKIIIQAGAGFTNESDCLYVEYLCGSNAFAIFTEFKKMMDNGSGGSLWPNLGNNWNFLYLGAINNYLTVSFYVGLGFKQYEHRISDVTGNLDDFVKSYQRIHKDIYVDELQVWNYLKDYFIKPKCEIADHLIDTIYRTVGCGGKMYLYSNDSSLRLMNWPEILRDRCIEKIDEEEAKLSEAKRIENERLAKENIKNTVAEMAESGKFDFKFTSLNKMPDILPMTNSGLTFNIKMPKPTTTLAERMKLIRDAKIRGEIKQARSDVLQELQNEQSQIKPNRTFLRPSRVLTNEAEKAYEKIRPLKRANRIDYEQKDPRERYLALNPTKAQKLQAQKSKLRPLGDLQESGLDRIQGSGLKGTKFYEELKSYGISPEAYLKQMKIWAKKSGYDEKQLTLATNDKNKLRILTVEGTKHFGRVGYKDYYIYKHLEKKKLVKKGYAKIMRDRFRKSHGAISKRRKLGRNSANELSIRILWHEDDDEKESKRKGLN